MDNIRGFQEDDDRQYDSDLDGVEDDDDAVMDAPHSFGTNERRMHVRAYNYWAKMLGDRQFPSIEDLDPENIEDFGPNSVLLDFTAGMENPAISFVGDALRAECELEHEISHLDQVPGRSLLSRITDHFLQIVANKAPIGFEAEFVNQRGVTIMYRGILLPFSSDDDNIDFIYGVINWKEMADRATTDALIRDVEKSVANAPRKPALPVWDDGPDEDMAPGNLTARTRHKEPLVLSGFEMSDFSGGDVDGYIEILDLDSQNIEAQTAIDEGPVAPDASANLADWLFYARELAQIAGKADERSREALYQAIGRAYDFALMARQAPDDFSELLEDAGLTVQVRAPMTPVVKLIFGADYDKTRIAEYATVLGFAMHERVAMGALTAYLQEREGGLKAIVKQERTRRRNKLAAPSRQNKLLIAQQKLRAILPKKLDNIDVGDEEFVVLVARRDSNGDFGVVASLSGTDRLTEQVLRKFAD